MPTSRHETWHGGSARSRLPSDQNYENRMTSFGEKSEKQLKNAYFFDFLIFEKRASFS